MRHFDEYILELYVLGAPEAADQAQEIKAHLDECYGCRAIVEQLQMVYENTNDELEKNDSLETSQLQTTALQHSHQKVTMFDRRLRRMPLAAGSNRLVRVRSMLRRHPVAAGTAVFSFIAILAFIVISVFRTDRSDHSLGYALANEDVLTLYSSKDDQLWKLVVPKIKEFEQIRITSGTRPWIISDLHGDGNKQLLIAAPYIPSISNEQGAALYAFAADRSLLFRKTFEATVDFHGRHYSSQLNIGGDDVAYNDSSGKEEIYVLAGAGRSPNVIYRLDAFGETIGEYWHYGSLNGPVAFDIDNDGKKELVLWGVNDYNDLTDPAALNQPVAIVLDPDKIIGKTECSVTPGFGFERSKAERYYIRFPSSVTNIALKIPCAIVSFRQPGKSTIAFWCMSGLKDKPTNYEYIFTPTMNIAEVKSFTDTERLHTDLYRNGKVAVPPGFQYLEMLKDDVQYWNGTEWTNHATHIRVLP